MSARAFACLLTLVVAGAASADSRGLACEPTSLAPDSATLTLTLPDPHGRELAVKRPDGEFFYLAWDEHAGIENATPRIQGFRDAHVLTLDPRTLEGWHFTKDGAWLPIFDAPGKYAFVTADVLQTDATPVGTIPPSRCIVEYRK
jgi:hypothetical protein